MKKTTFLFLLLGAILSGFAQNTLRLFQGITENDNTIDIKITDGLYRVKFYSSEIVETSYIPKGQGTSKASHAVVLLPEKIKTTLKETSSRIIYTSDGISVEIVKKPFQINYFFKGKRLISESEKFYSKDSLEVLSFDIENKESLYGGGARVLGMNRRGHRLELYNKAHYGYETYSELMNFTIPMVLSSKKYAIHFDNPQIGFLDLDSNEKNTLKYEVIGGRKTYQVIAGESWKNILGSYTKLTGKQPLPARWVFGNFASRFGYHSEKEARNTVAKFREEQIPLDAIIFDLYWFGKGMKGTMGDFEFYKDSFPTPKKMIQSFKKKGVKTILITEPFILNTSKNWSHTVSENLLGRHKDGKPYVYDFYFGTTGLLDVFNPKTKKWFWNIYKKYNDIGVAGWWGDLGEPEVHPSGLQHVNGTADEVHNIFGHNWAKLIYEGYEKEYPNKRPFILMRSGYSGSQRFGMIPWSGDVNRTWGGLQAQMEISLQMGMQGMAYMHSDLGGFAGAVDDTELYTRWLQYGVFQPVFRPHAQEDVASEPVFKDTHTKELAKKAIQLRYQLLPYNYNLAFENNQKGLPLMRPLLFEEPENKKIHSVAHTYLWGNEILVHPIVNVNQETAEVYFPKTNNWFDFYTDEKHLGGQTKEIQVQEIYIPTYVRGGAFIPMIKTIQSTDSYSLKKFDLHFYYDSSVAESKGTLYNDDGATKKAFEKGKYEILYFKSKLSKNRLAVEIDTELGEDYPTSTKEVQYIIHNIKVKPKKLKVNNRKIDFSWKDDKLTVKTKFSGKNKLVICW